MIGTMQPKEMKDFYAKVLGKEPDWQDGNWCGWQIGGTHLTLGEHDQMGGKAKDPGRTMFNFETSDVRGEFDRIKDVAGLEIVKEPYNPGEASEMLIATLADPDGNYFQLMSPMPENPSSSKKES